MDEVVVEAKAEVDEVAVVVEAEAEVEEAEDASSTAARRLGACRRGAGDGRSVSAARSVAWASGGSAAAARSSRESMRTYQPAGRVSVWAALLMSTWMRGCACSRAAQKASTSRMSESSKGPATERRWRHCPKSGSREYRSAASHGKRVVVTTVAPARSSFSTVA